MEYQRLGTSGLQISKIILGCMSYGSSIWQDWVLDEDKALPLLKAAYDAGITTWDTADIYSHGESERLVRKAIEKYQIPRKRLVILSKCFFAVSDEGKEVKGWGDMSIGRDTVNQSGLSRKHIFDAVDASVARLGTHIDLLQIHRFDNNTPISETMEALHDVVKSGKVRYIGASTMWAHQFAMMQFEAERHGWTKFVSMQGFYNLLYREEEREMIPFCNKTGVGLIPWSPLARGALTRPYRDHSTVRASSDAMYSMLFTKDAETHEATIDKEVTNRVQQVAEKRGVSMAIVATAWVLSKGCAPIVGINSTERIEEAVKAVKFKLTEEEVKLLEEAYTPKRIQGALQ